MVIPPKRSPSRYKPRSPKPETVTEGRVTKENQTVESQHDYLQRNYFLLRSGLQDLWNLTPFGKRRSIKNDFNRSTAHFVIEGAVEALRKLHLKQLNKDNARIYKKAAKERLKLTLFDKLWVTIPDEYILPESMPKQPFQAGMELSVIRNAVHAFRSIATPPEMVQNPAAKNTEIDPAQPEMVQALNAKDTTIKPAAYNSALSTWFQQLWSATPRRYKTITLSENRYLQILATTTQTIQGLKLELAFATDSPPAEFLYLDDSTNEALPENLDQEWMNLWETLPVKDMILDGTESDERQCKSKILLAAEETIQALKARMKFLHPDPKRTEQSVWRSRAQNELKKMSNEGGSS